MPQPLTQKTVILLTTLTLLSCYTPPPPGSWVNCKITPEQFPCNVKCQGAAFFGIILTEAFQGIQYTIDRNKGYNTLGTEYWKDTGHDIQEAINASNGIIQPGFQSKGDLDKFNEMLFSKKKDD